jgi:DNA-3-methyladenine glycosylase II
LIGWYLPVIIKFRLIKMKKKITITMESEPIKYLIRRDKKFKILYNLVGELSYSLYNDYYGFIIETIIGQMLSNKVADVLTGRLINICNSGKIDIESIKNLSFKKILSIGISRSKTQCIIDFTDHYIKNKYTKKKLSRLSDEEIIKEITSIKGLGTWSAKMFLLFVLGRENILPLEDSAYMQAFIWYNGITSPPSKSKIKDISDKWNPYNSIVARYLYRALDNGLTKKPFSSYKISAKKGSIKNEK